MIIIINVSVINFFNIVIGIYFYNNMKCKKVWIFFCIFFYKYIYRYINILNICIVIEFYLVKFIKD